MGPDGVLEMKARAAAAITFVVTLPILIAGSQTRELTAHHPILTGVIGAALASAFMYFMASQPARAAGAFAKAVTMPSGKSTPYEEQFSREESLAARGDVAGALEAFERVIAEQPSAIAPRMRAAELYASRGGNPGRAAELFREIRGIAGVPVRDAVYASSRLVDLYDGALDDPGRALVELRRIIELYPGTPVATHARNALPGMKTRLKDGSATPD
jgi:tetratricopeptide (TPR) repeat protein